MQPSGDQPGQISSTELNMQLAALVEQRKKEKLVRRISPAAIHMQLRQVVAGWLTRSVHAGFRPPNAKSTTEIGRGEQDGDAKSWTIIMRMTHVKTSCSTTGDLFVLAVF